MKDMLHRYLFDDGKEELLDVLESLTVWGLYIFVDCRLGGMQQLLSPPQEIDVGQGVAGGLRGWAEVFRIDQASRYRLVRC